MFWNVDLPPRRYIPEDRMRHKRRCENLKSYIVYAKMPVIFGADIYHGIKSNNTEL
jgi:hypothetical protein